MSYAGTAICEISHLMLIAVSPIASQHRFHSEVYLVSAYVNKIDLAVDIYL